jgi:methylmalonyl-CoA mutase
MSKQGPELHLPAGFPPATPEAWLALVSTVLKGADFEKRLVTRMLDGMRIAPLYTRADEVPGAVTARPGEPPFTRGTATGRKETGWDVRQFHSETDPRSLNTAILEDLQGGATSIALHVASPGTSGLALDDNALATALDGVPLDACAIALVAGEGTGAAVRALEKLWADRQVPEALRRAQFNSDPLGWLAQTGGLSQRLDDALSAAAALACMWAGHDGVTTLIADGNPYHAAGASEAQELAAMLATMTAYLRAAEAEGLPPERALPAIAVALATDTDLFLSIAKLRAARRLVWRIAAASGAGPAAAHVHFTGVTAWRMLSRRDPWTNIMRTTIACMGAALGGADAIVVLPFTYALGKPDRFARRIARNVQIVCREEASLGRVIDPAGGSWYVEKLTEDLAVKAWELFQAIEARGGMAAAITSGYIQDEIGKVAEQRGRDIATGRMELTGVSAFPLLGDDGIAAEPWPRAQSAAFTSRTGERPRVFLACLGTVADFGPRATWVRNFLASGGIDVTAEEGLTSSGAAGAAFSASGAEIACIASSDAVYTELGEAATQALKSAGARQVALAGRPGSLEALLRRAGVDCFWHTGQDAIAALGELHRNLGIVQEPESRR